MAFYQKAYETIRTKNQDALVVISSTFNPSTYPFPNFVNTIEDTHIYFGMTISRLSMDQKENLRQASMALGGVNWQVLVGEWSLGPHNPKHDEWNISRRDKFLASFAKMQLQAWETHSIGWFYWSYKTRYPSSTWNFRDMCEGGLLPGCTQDLVYASPDWWNEPMCTYAYLDGGCPAPRMNMPLRAMLVLVFASAGITIYVLKPRL